MRPRFLALFPTGQATVDPALRDRLAAAGLEEVRRPGVLLFIDRATRRVPVGDHGLILGSLFHRRDDAALVADIDDADRRLIVGSRGKRLIEAFWGAYVAILGDPDNGVVDVVRDPSPMAPCYHGQCGHGTLLVSHLDVLRISGLMAITVASAPLAAFLLDGNARPPATCIEGLAEMTSGTRLTMSGAAPSVTPLWSPWQFAARSQWLDDPQEAEQRLREEILRCVRAWSQIVRRPLLGVSGGLDSSIVAAALKAAGAEPTCVTIATEDARGDEREPARLLAEALGWPLIERFETMAAVDLTITAAAHVPRPTARAFAQSGDQIQREIGKAVGCDGYMTGAGGDNLFCYMRSVTPVVDRLQAEGPGRGALATAIDIARLCDQGLTSVVARALRRALSPPDYRPVRAPDLLSAEAMGLARAVVPHPWTQGDRTIPPGKHMHIAWIRGIENHLEGYGREQDHPMIAPLMSQPIIELCLRIPTWHWYRGGRDRALARSAFARLLPRAIIERRTKGTPSSFVMQLLERDRAMIGRFLEEGVLARAGLIDLPTLRDQLSAPGPVRSSSYLHVMSLVDAEAWARTVQRA